MPDPTGTLDIVEHLRGESQRAFDLDGARLARLDEAADEIERLRRERDSLARRCSVRFEETEAALAVVRQYAARWTPDLDTGLWWRNDLRTSRPITSSEMTALRRSFDDAPEPTDA